MALEEFFEATVGFAFLSPCDSFYHRVDLEFGAALRFNTLLPALQELGRGLPSIKDQLGQRFAIALLMKYPCDLIASISRCCALAMHHQDYINPDPWRHTLLSFVFRQWDTVLPAAREDAKAYAHWMVALEEHPEGRSTPMLRELLRNMCTL